MLEQMENGNGNVVLSHARPATATPTATAPSFLTLSLSPLARACKCVCVGDYLHCHTFIIVSVFLRYLVLCSALQGCAEGCGRMVWGRAKWGRVQADSCCSIALSCVRWWM